MPQLTPEQIKKRGLILQEMSKDYGKGHRFLTTREAQIEFCESIENDPMKLRIINAMAASQGGTCVTSNV
jgi:hypothetical protein